MNDETAGVLGLAATRRGRGCSSWGISSSDISVSSASGSSSGSSPDISSSEYCIVKSLGPSSSSLSVG